MKSGRKSTKKAINLKKFPPNLGITLLFSKVKEKGLIPFFVILLLSGLFYYFKNQFIVALVNNQPIWRFTLIREVEKQAGKTTLESLITKALVLQEAKKEGVKISDKEIDEELKNLETSLKEQGQDLDKLLEAQGMDRAEIKEQIRMQKTVEAIVGQDVEVSDEEIDAYIEENKSFLPEDQDVEEIKPVVREQLKQQKMSEKIGEWLESLREKANINYFREF